jgi:hypothetical protein
MVDMSERIRNLVEIGCLLDGVDKFAGEIDVGLFLVLFGC